MPTTPPSPATTDSTAKPKNSYAPVLMAVGGTILAELFVSVLPPSDTSTSVGTPLGWIIAVGLLAVCVYSLVVQWRLFAASRRLLLRLQVVLLAVTAALIPLAALAGDIAGGITFHTPSEISVAGLLILAAVSASVATVILAIGNALYILTRFHVVMKVLGYIAFVLCWLAVAFVTYCAYNLVYSMHDPSSE